jgi:hypothetical protein
MPKSVSDPELCNDEYAWIDRCATAVFHASRKVIEVGHASRITDHVVRQLFTAAIRLHYAKAQGEERAFCPIVGREGEELTASELVSAVSELLRSMNLGPIELALWYWRRPDET